MTDQNELPEEPMYKSGDKFQLPNGTIVQIYGVSKPWGNEDLGQAYEVGTGPNFLPGFTGEWINVAEFESAVDVGELIQFNV